MDLDWLEAIIDSKDLHNQLSNWLELNRFKQGEEELVVMNKNKKLFYSTTLIFSLFL